VKEIEKLYQTGTSRFHETLASDAGPAELARGKHFDLQLEIAVGGASEIEINVRGIAVVCDVVGKRLTGCDYSAPLNYSEGKVTLRILMDRICLELFAENGLIYMPLAVLPDEENDLITIQARGGAARLEKLSCHELKSIWE
jgi:sucrose-6-phosphate hydrolase SacC (GH32 family)